MIPFFGCLGWVVFAAVTVAIARLFGSMYASVLSEARDLEKRVTSLEKSQVIEGEAPQWARDQDAFVYGQEVVIEIAGEDVSFKATFQGVDVGIDGSPWVVFKVGDAAPKMLPVSRVYMSACESADENTGVPS